MGAVAGVGMGLQVAGDIQKTIGAFQVAKQRRSDIKAARQRIQGLYFARPREQRLRRAGTDLFLDVARPALERAAFQTNLLQPDLLRLAGLDVDVAGGPETLAAATSARAAATAAGGRLSAAQAAFAAVRRKGKGKAKARKALNRAQGEYMDAAAAAARAESGVGAITGVRRTGLPGASAAEADIVSQLEGRVAAGLRGEGPVPPELLRELEEQEMALRNEGARRLGPDWATSSSGIESLTAFNRARAESIFKAKRADVTDFLPLATGARKSFADLAEAQQQAMLRPGFAAGIAGEGAGNLARGMGDFSMLFQRDREKQIDAELQIAQLRMGAPHAVGTGLIVGGEAMAEEGKQMQSMGGANKMAGGSGGFGDVFGGGGGKSATAAGAGL